MSPGTPCAVDARDRAFLRRCRPAAWAVAVACLPLSAAAEDGAAAKATSASWPGERWAVLRQANEQGLYPRLGSIHDGSGPALGMAFWRPRLLGSPIDFYAATAGSLRDDEMNEVRLGRVPHAAGRPPSSRDALDRLGSVEDRWFLYASLRGRETVRDRFLDSGPAAGGARERFAMGDTAFELAGGYRLRRGLVTGLRAGLLRFDPEEAADVPGADYFRLGAELALERRDRPANPHRGHFVGLSAASFSDRTGGGRSFRRFTVDARKYQPLGSERHVLAVRALGSFDQGGGAGVPFYLQETLGGKRVLRAYPNYRFRGTRVMALSAEYRFEPLRTLELAAFYDGGAASGAPGEEGTGLLSSYGLGLRLKRHDRVLLRLDAARGAEGTRVRLAVGAAF